jgi:N-ethylmaleimide reductase
MSSLFDPFHIGDIAVHNRVAMAPLTRNRAAAHQVPAELAVTYYTQRASAGLLITEATQISPTGQGYLDTPGLHSEEQVAAWKRITDAVHAKGGKIVVQLWHVGRVSHVSLQPGGIAPVSSSARQANTKTFVKNGFEPVSAPRALAQRELPGIVHDYQLAARNAIAAGFDGVEVHSANGYLLDQFNRDSLNDRNDDYGGSIENRTRLLMEVMRAVIDEVGAGRTGIRLSPVTPANDLGQDSDAQALYGHIAEQLGDLKVAFIHVVEGATGGPRDNVAFDYGAMRSRYLARNAKGAWIVNNGYTRDMAIDAVASGKADLVAFGKAFISNPDLVHRLKDNLPLTEPKKELFYGGGAEGYTDYPRVA